MASRPGGEKRLQLNRLKGKKGVPKVSKAVTGGHARQSTEGLGISAEIHRSMQLATDPRYKEIDNFKEVGMTRLEGIMASDSGHPQRRLYPEQWKFPEPIGTRAALTRIKYAPEQDGQGCDPSEVGPPPTPPVQEPDRLDPQQELLALASREVSSSSRPYSDKFSGRLHWEESFRSNVNKLMVDFKLSQDPGCRLHHLDRFHDWFAVQGKKQTRKEAAGPSFLTFDKHSAPAPGSARSIAPPYSTATVNLACTLQMQNRCPRIQKHLSVVPPPPPPPGYK